MKKIIIVCNTVMQIIVAVQIRLHMHSKDHMTIIVSDQSSKDAKNITLKLKEKCLFNEAYYVCNKELCMKKNNILDKYLDLWYMTIGKRIITEMKDYKYDELLYYNPDVFTHILFSEIKKFNPQLVVKRYEEGILSYNNEFPLYSKLKLSNSMRRWLKKSTLEDATNTFICFYPSVYSGGMNTIQLPLIENTDSNSIFFKELFGYNEEQNNYKQKYVFFTSVFDFEGGKSIGEFDLILKIAHMIGKDNLLIKAHPRDNIKKFIDAGLSVDVNSHMPWEIIQLGGDFSKHVFLTVNSTSPLSISLLQDTPPKVLYLFPLCYIDENPVAIMAIDNINKLFSNKIIQSKSKYFKISSDLSDI